MLLFENIVFMASEIYVECLCWSILILGPSDITITEFLIDSLSSMLKYEY